MSEALQKPSGLISKHGRMNAAFYYPSPKCSAIVQSSGMGKSRTMDEMSKSHFVIPIKLRQPGSSGILIIYSIILLEAKCPQLL